MADTPKQWLTISDILVEGLLGDFIGNLTPKAQRTKIYKMIRAGTLPTKHLTGKRNKQYLVHRDDIIKLIGR